MDAMSRDFAEGAHHRPVPPLTFALLTALARELGPLEYGKVRAEHAVRHTSLSPAEEQAGWDEAARLGLIDHAGHLTEKGRSGAFGLLSAL